MPTRRPAARTADAAAQAAHFALGPARLARRPGVGLLVFVVAVHWFERDGLRDNHDGQISFIDVIYFTMVSITTTGYGDIVPVSRSDPRRSTRWW